MVCSKL